MTLSINCKDVGDKVCNHTLYYEPEEELFANAKEDRYTEETRKEEISGNLEHFKKLIKEIWKLFICLLIFIMIHINCFTKIN